MATRAKSKLLKQKSAKNQHQNKENCSTERSEVRFNLQRTIIPQRPLQKLPRKVALELIDYLPASQKVSDYVPPYDWRKEHAKCIKAIREDREIHELRKRLRQQNEIPIRENQMINRAPRQQKWYVKSEQYFQTPTVAGIYLRIAMKPNQ